MYDIIGDIHGYASVLKNLLSELGYRNSDGVYRHPERKALFVGDYIDRGPEIPETLQLVRSMAEADEAIALMGNHEFNAILYNEPDGEGGFLRAHSAKNNGQHAQTLQQFRGREAAYADYIEWFRTLPVYFENENFRAVHACWDDYKISQLQPYLNGAVLKDEYYREAGDRDTHLYGLLDDVLKGMEVALPEGTSFSDKDGHERAETRIKWWLNPVETTISDWSFSEVDIGEDARAAWKYNIDSYYDDTNKPVFFGHYWLQGEPSLQRDNVCCLDYSIGKKDKLVAYRYDGEQQLSADKFVWEGYGE